MKEVLNKVEHTSSWICFPEAIEYGLVGDSIESFPYVNSHQDMLLQSSVFAEHPT